MPEEEVPVLIQQLKSPRPTWAHILKRVREHPSEVRYIDAVSGQTALHWAIERRSTSSSRLQAIAGMLAWYPGATMIRCKFQGYTPLDKVAASRTDNDYILESDAKVAELLIRCQKEEVLLFNSRNNLERLTPLSLHVKHMSLLQSRLKATSEMNSSANTTNKQTNHLHRVSKVVLGTIAPHCSLETLSEALEMLYSCNTLLVMDMLSQDAGKQRTSTTSRSVALDFGKHSRDQSATTTGHWIWEWLLDILAVLHTRTCSDHRQAPFRVLHWMSSLPNCPPPFLLLAMRAYPDDVRITDTLGGNLPLHCVAGWPTDTKAGNVRKYMCIESLSVAYEEALSMANADGKTPVTLDNEAGSNLLDMGGGGAGLIVAGEMMNNDDETSEGEQPEEFYERRGLCYE